MWSMSVQLMHLQTAENRYKKLLRCEGQWMDPSCLCLVPFILEVVSIPILPHSSGKKVP